MDTEKKTIFDKEYRLWFMTTTLLVSTIFFFWEGPDYESPRSFKEFWNIGHIVYFALLSQLLSKWKLITHQLLLRQWVIILSITLAIGILFEVLQYGTQRTPDLWDISRDITGSFLILSFSPSYAGIKIKKWEVLIKSTAVIVFLCLLLPLTISLVDETIARQQFPVLSDFETPFEMGRWNGDAVMTIKKPSSLFKENILEISLSTKQYSGVALKYFPEDWRNFQTLKIKIFQPQETPLKIIFRIHDLQHTLGYQEYEDRFNQGFLLTQGWNEIDINLNEVASAPKSREMDLNQIRGLGIFATSLPHSRQIFLDKVYLSR